MMALTAQIKAKQARLARLTKETKQVEKELRSLQQQNTLDKVKQSGVTVGKFFKAIPTENAGDVLEGKVIRVQPISYRGGVRIIMLVPAKGRFMQRTVYIDLDRYELEPIPAPKK